MYAERKNEHFRYNERIKEQKDVIIEGGKLNCMILRIKKYSCIQ